MYKMQRLEVNGAVRPIYGSLGVKRLRWDRWVVQKFLCEITAMSYVMTQKSATLIDIAVEALNY